MSCDKIQSCSILFLPPISLRNLTYNIINLIEFTLWITKKIYSNLIQTRLRKGSCMVMLSRPEGKENKILNYQLIMYLNMDDKVSVKLNCLIW